MMHRAKATIANHATGVSAAVLNSPLVNWQSKNVSKAMNNPIR